MKATPEHHARIAQLTFASVYPHYLTKIESKNKPAVTALREIAAGKVGLEMLKKVPN